MKLLILGANGMVGHVLATYFSEKNYEVHTMTRSCVNFGINHVIDAMDTNTLKHLLQKEKFDVVINCIGLLNTDCDKNSANAVFLNSYFPHFLKNELLNTNTYLVHLSTDCVFSGEKGSYCEIDFPDGKTIYDRSKAMGEIFGDNILVFRNSVIGPDHKINGIGLFNWFMQQNDKVNGYSKVIWNGMATVTLARAIEKAIQVKLTGLYQLVGEPIDKYSLLHLFNEIRKNPIKIGVNDQVVLNKSLVNTREDFMFEVPSYKQQVEEMREWIKNHPDLYPHYEVV